MKAVRIGFSFVRIATNIILKCARTGGITMDEMKKKNIKDYTAWDLNPSCFKPKTDYFGSKTLR